MTTPTQFLQTIHKIAASVPADQFEDELQKMCQRLAQGINHLKEDQNGKESEPDR